MKQKDLLLIVVVIGVSAIISIIVARIFISSPKNRSEKVEIVDKISPDFNKPNPQYFNAQSIDPTNLIKIGGNNNTDPFK